MSCAICCYIFSWDRVRVATVGACRYDYEGLSYPYKSFPGSMQLEPYSLTVNAVSHG